MDIGKINVGEEFQINGEHYKKTKEGFKRLPDGQYVDLVDGGGEVIMERRLING